MEDHHPHIRETFRQMFESEGFELPNPIPGKGHFNGGGWYVQYVLWKDDEGRDCLDYTVDHRMTNPGHGRILIDGSRLSLSSLQTAFGYDPKVTGSKEQAEKEFRAHNDAVVSELKRKGL